MGNGIGLLGQLTACAILHKGLEPRKQVLWLITPFPRLPLHHKLAQKHLFCTSNYTYSFFAIGAYDTSRGTIYKSMIAP